MFRAKIKFKKFEQDGWDKLVSYYYEVVESGCMVTLKDMVADQIHHECITVKGDFGIILKDIEHVDTEYMKVIQTELVEGI